EVVPSSSFVFAMALNDSPRFRPARHPPTTIESRCATDRLSECSSARHDLLSASRADYPVDYAGRPTFLPHPVGAACATPDPVSRLGTSDLNDPARCLQFPCN